MSWQIITQGIIGIPTTDKHRQAAQTTSIISQTASTGHEDNPQIMAIGINPIIASKPTAKSIRNVITDINIPTALIQKQVENMNMIKVGHHNSKVGMLAKAKYIKQHDK
jgi:hypothetical protein